MSGRADQIPNPGRGRGRADWQASWSGLASQGWAGLINPLIFVVLDGAPWGFAFLNSQVAQRDSDVPMQWLLTGIKAILSPIDGYTYMFKWMNPIHQCLKAYVPLGRFLAMPEWDYIARQGWFERIEYRRGSIHGPIITKEEAIALSNAFAPPPPPEDEPEPQLEVEPMPAPQTAQASRTRTHGEAFPPIEPGPSQPSPGRGRGRLRRAVYRTRSALIRPLVYDGKLATLQVADGPSENPTFFEYLFICL